MKFGYNDQKKTYGKVKNKNKPKFIV